MNFSAVRTWYVKQAGCTHLRTQFWTNKYSHYSAEYTSQGNVMLTAALTFLLKHLMSIPCTIRNHGWTHIHVYLHTDISHGYIVTDIYHYSLGQSLFSLQVGQNTGLIQVGLLSAETSSCIDHLVKCNVTVRPQECAVSCECRLC